MRIKALRRFLNLRKVHPLLSLLCIAGCVGAIAAASLRFANAAPNEGTLIYLPSVIRFVCDPIPDATYGTLAPINPATGVDMETHPDVNLAVRSYEPTSAFKGLIDDGNIDDPQAPQLPSLFSDNRTGVFSSLSQVYNWDWNCKCKGPLIGNPPVTLAGLETTPDEVIHAPDSGYDIGGYDMLVLYAAPTRITLKYTREDDVIFGYAIHLENVCIDPNLLALYRSTNAAGRHQLPALHGGQAIGRAIGNEIGVAVRDTGAFMDPRSRNSWWIGR